MRRRTIITCLLAIALAATSAARPPAPPAEEEGRITPEEEREARELVGEFNRKFAVTHDIAPLVGEYFVDDFASRLSRPPGTFPFSLIDWKDESAPPDPEDLRRFYVAGTNFLHDFMPLYAAALRACAEKKGEDVEEAGETCDDDGNARLKKVLPPEAVEIMKAAPRQLREWLGSDEEDTQADAGVAQAGGAVVAQEAAPAAEVVPPPDAGTQQAAGCAGECAKADGGKDQPVRDGKELRHLTSIFESLNKVLSAHLKAHPVSFEKNAAGEGGGSESDDPFLNFDPERIEIFNYARVLGKEFYGYPAGTRLLCANAGGLHVEMVRVDDGRLRILTVYFLIED